MSLLVLAVSMMQAPLWIEEWPVYHAQISVLLIAMLCLIYYGKEKHIVTVFSSVISFNKTVREAIFALLQCGYSILLS